MGFSSSLSLYPDKVRRGSINLRTYPHAHKKGYVANGPGKSVGIDEIWFECQRYNKWASDLIFSGSSLIYYESVQAPGLSIILLFHPLLRV